MEFKCTKIGQDSFDKIKRIVAHDTLLAYTDFHKGFKIHTNSSNFQLGAVIRQKGELVAFHSRKLTDSQKSYIVTEK